MKIKDLQIEEVSLTKNCYEIGGKVTYEEDEKSTECETCIPNNIDAINAMKEQIVSLGFDIVETTECETCGATPASDFNGQCLCMNCVQNDVFESMNENAD
jgi:hypothetical protein